MTPITPTTPAVQAADGDTDSAALLSEQWYRIAGLRPRLNPQSSLRRIAYRGQPWMVLVMPGGRDRVRLNAAAWAFFGRCDGSQTTERVWQALLVQLGDDVPTQDELLAMTFELWRVGALAFDQPADFGMLAQAPVMPQRTPTPSSWMAWKVSFGSPDATFSRLDAIARRLFGALGLSVATGIAAIGAALAVSQGDVIGELLGRLPHSPHLLVATWLVFIALKLIHEAAHGLALRRYGLPVPDWGVTLMLLTPVPYVDAGPADGLPSPTQRFVVSAAGLLVEGALAVAALLIALGLPAGPARDVALIVFMVGAVSSWAVNANPFLRFDGYFAATDLLELPNLATRSATHWANYARRAVGLPPRVQAATSRLESVLWWLYAPISWMVRVAVAAGITAWSASASAWIAVTLGSLFVWTLLVAPVLRGLREWSVATPAAAASARRRRWAVGAAAMVVTSLTLVPAPHTVSAQGIVWLADDRAVRTATSGLVVEAPEASDGRAVVAGERLFRLEDPELAVSKAQLDLQIAQLRTEQADAQGGDLARARRLGFDIASREAERDRLEQRLRDLDLKAVHAGQLALVAPRHWRGLVVEQGATLAWVVPHGNGEEPLVRVALPATTSQGVADRAREVRMTFASDDSRWWSGIVERDHRTAQHELPSAALSDRFGGRIAADPTDPSGARALHRVVLVDVRRFRPPDAGAANQPVPPRLGERAEVAFVLEPRSLALQAAEALQRWWRNSQAPGAEQ